MSKVIAAVSLFMAVLGQQAPTFRATLTDGTAKATRESGFVVK